MNVTDVRVPSAVLAVGEKALSTFVQVFGVLMVEGWTVGGLSLDMSQAAFVAAVASTITVIANAVSGALVPTTLSLQAQVALRALRTFGATFLGALLAVPQLDLLQVGTWELAGVAGVAAAVAGLKAELGAFIGDRGTVAWLGEQADPGVVPVGDVGDDDPDVEPGELPEWAQ